MLAIPNRVERPKRLFSQQLFLLQRDPDCLAARETPGRLRPVQGNALPSAGSAVLAVCSASAVDHRPHESLTSDPKSRRRWPTAGLAKTPFKQLHPATTFNFKPPQIASMRSLLAVSSCANETRAKFGWRGLTSVRRLTFARGSLSTAVELGRASNHVPRRTTPRPQTPSRLTSRRYAGEPKLASRACSKSCQQGSELRANISHANPFVKLAYGLRSRSLCGDLRHCRQCEPCWRKAARIPAVRSWAAGCLICLKSFHQNGLSYRLPAAISPSAPPPIMPSLRPAVSSRLAEFPKVLAAAAPIPRESENLGRAF